MFVETGQQIYQELIRQRVQRQTWEQTAPTKREGEQGGEKMESLWGDEKEL